MSPTKFNGSRKLRLRQISIKDLEERGDIFDELPMGGGGGNESLVSIGSPFKISEKTGMSFKRPKSKIPNLSMPRGFYD